MIHRWWWDHLFWEVFVPGVSDLLRNTCFWYTIVSSIMFEPYGVPWKGLWVVKGIHSCLDAFVKWFESLSEKYIQNTSICSVKILFYIFNNLYHPYDKNSIYKHRSNNHLLDVCNCDEAWKKFFFWLDLAM